MLIYFGFYPIIQATAYVTDDEDLISTDSNYSEESEAPERDILVYRSNSIKHLDILIKNGVVDVSQSTWLKEKLESFYTKVCTFIIVDLSPETYKTVLEIKSILEKSLFPSGEWFLCSNMNLAYHRDSIVRDLEMTAKLIELSNN